MAKEEKEKKTVSILDYCKTLNKTYGCDTLVRKASIIPGYARLKTAALGMDYSLYGGLALGRMHEFSGQEHSGKTVGACAQLAAFQKQYPDKICLFVDVEQAADLEFLALMNGVDLSKVLIMEPDEGMSGEQILEAILDMQYNTDDIGCIVLDSIPALETARNLANEFTKDMGKQATIAKSLGKFLKQMLPSLRKKQNMLICINQVRVKDYTFQGAPIYDEPGGAAPKFYATTRIRFATRVFMQGEDEKGSSNGDNADGFRIKFKIVKNKTAACNRGGGFITYRYETGMDSVGDLFDIGIAFDYIKALSSKTYALVNLETGDILNDENGKPLQGYKKVLIGYLRTHDAFRETYMQMLTDYISAANTKKNSTVSLLDEQSSAELAAEEEAMTKKIKKNMTKEEAEELDESLVEEDKPE